MNPLLIAEAANPEWVSVPLVGWSLARAIQLETGGHIVTQIRNREAFLRAGLLEGQDFTAIDSEAIAAPLHKFSQAVTGGKGLGWTFGTAVQSISYPYFEKLVWSLFKDRLAAGEFSLVHRITPLTPTAPSSLAKKCRSLGVPFVLGPLNGGVPWPKAFDKERRREKEWLSYVRGAYKLMPGRLATLEAADLIIAGSRYTQNEIPRQFDSKIKYMPENGVDPNRFPRLKVKTAVHSPLKVCFIGRMVPYKGPDMLLEACYDGLKSNALELHYIGDGPLLAELKDKVRAEGLDSRVIFHGWLEHIDVGKIVQRCDVLGFPSIREFGGGVVLEAMYMGCVPIIADYAGPGELIDETRGLKIRMGDKDHLVDGFKQALARLIGLGNGLLDMSNAGQSFVTQNFLWSAKAAEIISWYSQIAAAKASV